MTLTPAAPAPLLLVGQSLEFWRLPLAAALTHHDPMPVLKRAARQLDTGARALDLNFGLHAGAAPLETMRWTAQLLRAQYPELPLWIDCGELDLMRALATASLVPFVLNSVPMTCAAGAQALLEAASECNAGVVFSPRAAVEASTIERVRASYARALTLIRAHGITATCYFDCLAYPLIPDLTDAFRSLEWLRMLRLQGIDEGLLPLVAVGNAGAGTHSTAPATRVRAYTAAAIGAGARTLLAPVEDVGVRNAVAVASGARRATNTTERQWQTLAAAASGEQLRLLEALLNAG